MPVFFSIHSDVILCVLCCALLLAGVIGLTLAHKRVDLPAPASRYIGLGLIILALREWLGIFGVSEPYFISWYPLAAFLQLLCSLCLLLAARSVAPPGSLRRTAATVLSVGLGVVFAGVLLRPYLTYSVNLARGEALITATIFFSVKFCAFAASCVLLHCMRSRRDALPASATAALAVLCLHAFLIFVCRPPGLAGLHDDVEVLATHLNVWLFILRIATTFIIVVLFWMLLSHSVGAAERIRWWPLALAVFILAVAVAFVQASSYNYDLLIKRNLIATAQFLAGRISSNEVRRAAAAPDDPALVDAVFSGARDIRAFDGYTRLHFTIGVLAPPRREGGPTVALPDPTGSGSGRLWLAGAQPLIPRWNDIRGRPGYWPEGIGRLEPLLVTAPVPGPGDPGIAVLCVSAVDLILDQYLYKRPILAFFPLAFLALLLLMFGQHNAWLATQSLSEITALRKGALGNGLTGIIITRNRLVVDCNRRVAEMAGRPREALIGTEVGGVFDVEGPDCFLRLEEQRRRGGAPLVEMAATRPDGTPGHYLVHGRAQSGDSDDPCSIWEIVDISRIREMEKAVRGSRDYLQIIVDSIPAAVFVKDHDHRYQMMNGHFLDMLGVDEPGRIVGKRLTEVQIDYPEDVEERDDLAVDLRGGPLVYERTFDSPEGPRHYEVTKVVRWPDGNEDNHIVIGYAHDVTDHKNATEALRDERHFLRQLLDTLPMAVCFLDTHRIIRLCDRLFCREAGVRDAEELIGKHFDAVRPFGIDEAAEDRRLLERGHGHLETEFEVAEQDGRQRNFILRRTVMSAPDGAALGLVKTYWDATALVAANRAAKKADRAKAVFLANMSHELRTPMNGIVGMADLIIEHEATEPVPRLYAETVIKSAKTLQMVMDEVMDVAAIDDASRRFTLGEGPFPLLSLIEEAAQIVSCIVEAWGVEVCLDYDFRLGSIFHGDARHVRQVMVQVLTHCSRITADRRLRLAVAPSPDGVAFRCIFSPAHDIAPEELEAMFKRPGGDDDTIDLGMFNDRIGLPLAWKLIDVMAGSLSVARRDERIYCEVTLPLTPSPGPGGQPLSPPNLGTARVLVGTTDADWARSLRECLGYAGAQVGCVGSREEIERLLRRGYETGVRHDILILDAAVAGAPSGEGLQDFISHLATATHFGNPDIMLIVTARQVQDLTGLSGGIRCLLLPPLCPSEIWYKTEGIHVARESAAMLDMEPSGSVLRKSTSVKFRRSTRITRLVKIPASVLLVEDNNVNQMVAMGILKRLGCRTTVAKNGREAVDMVAEGQHFDLILMDCMMPIMDGYEATSQIRRHERAVHETRRHTIVALTANTVAGDRERCLAAGMDDYVTKPVTLEQLRETMTRHCPDLVTMVDQADGE